MLKQSSSGFGTHAPWDAREGNGPCWASTDVLRIACRRSRILPESSPRCLSIERAVPQKARVAILYSRPTLLLCDMEGQNVGHEKDALLSLWGCYRALLESHVPADFIDVDELKAGRAAEYDVLYLPHCYTLDAPTGVAVRRFAEAGGTVWADGLLGWKDPYGDLRHRSHGNDIAVWFRPPRH